MRVAAVVLVAALAAHAEPPPVDLARLFPEEAAITVAGGGLARLVLTPAVLGACRPDLSDVRVFDDAGHEIPYLADVKSTARQGSPEVQIAYDRQALVRLGLDLREVADLVRTKIRGSSATEYRKRERRIDIVVRGALAGTNADAGTWSREAQSERQSETEHTYGSGTHAAAAA